MNESLCHISVAMISCKGCHDNIMAVQTSGHHVSRARPFKKLDQSQLVDLSSYVLSACSDFDSTVRSAPFPHPTPQGRAGFSSRRPGSRADFDPPPLGSRRLRQTYPQLERTIVTTQPFSSMRADLTRANLLFGSRIRW